MSYFATKTSVVVVTDNVLWPIASQLGVGIPTISSLFNLIVFVSCFIQYFFVDESIGERRAAIKTRETHQFARNALFHIMMFTVFAMMSSATFAGTASYGLVQAPLNPDNYVCTDILPRLYSWSYGVAHWFRYLFLFNRVNVAGEPREHADIHRKLRIVVSLGMKLMILCICPVALITWRHTVVQQDGIRYCGPESVPLLNIGFALLDLPMGILFLLLFVWPILEHKRALKKITNAESSVRHKLSTVIHKNFRLALIGVGYTIFSMFLVGISAVVSGDRYDIGTISIAIANFDLVVNLIVMCSMTVNWMPLCLQQTYMKGSERTAVTSGKFQPATSALSTRNMDNRERTHTEMSTSIPIPP